jgi:D-inositol-3-phosphate glycosyltransferase
MIMITSTPKTRTPILLLSDAVAPTGFARVIESIFRPLAETYDIAQLGVNYRGDPHDWPWPIYATSSERDTWGTRRLPEILEKVRPRIVFILRDIRLARDYMPILERYRERCGGPFDVVAYLPVDAGPIVPEMLAPLAAVDRMVTYTEFGRRELERSFDEIERCQASIVRPPIDVIPHGVDTAVFRPAPEDDLERALASRKAAAKQALFGEMPDLESSFLVLNANRNQPRKRIDLTMKGFARFAEGKPQNVQLYLHMGPQDLGWDVVTLARLYGMEERLILTPTPPAEQMPCCSVDTLNRIYNACDVGVNTCYAEGWGLVSCEHGATGAAQIVPRHSACAEIWDGAARFLEPVATLTTPTYLSEEKIVSPDELALALEELYGDRDELRRLSLAAYRRMHDPTLSWSAIARRFDAVFHDVLTRDVRRDAGPLAQAA